MFADLDDAVTGTFGEPVIWRRPGGAESTVTAIVDILDARDLDDGGAPGSGNEIWTLSLPADRLPGFNRFEDRLVVKGRICKAATKPFTDVAGMLNITLEAV